MGDEQRSEPVDCGGVVADTSGCCVVLVTPGHARPESLLNDLTESGTQARVVDDPAYVMVELAQEQGRAAVVVTDPQQTRRLPQLLAAVRRYYPQVACWCYETINGHGQATLELLQKEMPSKDMEEDLYFVEAVQQNNPDSLQSENGQRLDKTPYQVKQSDSGVSDSDKDSRQPDGAAQDAAPEPLVTPEEFSMLMGPDFADGEQPADSNDPDEYWSP